MIVHNLFLKIKNIILFLMGHIFIIFILQGIFDGMNRKIYFDLFD